MICSAVSQPVLEDARREPLYANLLETPKPTDRTNSRLAARSVLTRSDCDDLAPHSSGGKGRGRRA